MINLLFPKVGDHYKNDKKKTTMKLCFLSKFKGPDM